MKIVAIGGRPFVSGFQLAGVEGVSVSTPKEALQNIKKLMDDSDIGLIIISDDFEKDIKNEITEIRLKKAIPIIYVVPAPGNKQEKVQYRELVKQMLKIG